jgi:hypothetical protein
VSDDDEPRVTITLPYRWALRLSYMARFPGTQHVEDNAISGAVDAAIDAATTGQGGVNALLTNLGYALEHLPEARRDEALRAARDAGVLAPVAHVLAMAMVRE